MQNARSPSKKWMKMEPLYRLFAGENERYSFTEEDQLEQFLYESQGKGQKTGLFSTGRINGYAVGKHNMDITIKMWNQDMRSGWPPLLWDYELYEDEQFKDYHWWLDRVLNPPKWMKYLRECGANRGATVLALSHTVRHVCKHV